MTADPDVYRVLDGRWIPRADIAAQTATGVRLHDGRIIGEVAGL